MRFLNKKGQLNADFYFPSPVKQTENRIFLNYGLMTFIPRRTELQKPCPSALNSCVTHKAIFCHKALSRIVYLAYAENRARAAR